MDPGFAGRNYARYELQTCDRQGGSTTIRGRKLFFTNLLINEARERDREGERETLKCYLHKRWEINYHPIIAAKNGK